MKRERVDATMLFRMGKAGKTLQNVNYCLSDIQSVTFQMFMFHISKIILLLYLDMNELMNNCPYCGSLSHRETHTFTFIRIQFTYQPEQMAKLATELPLVVS